MATYQSAYTGAQIDAAIQKTINLDSIIASAITEAKLAMYPVGSIYISLSNVSPSTFIGGTWEQIHDKFLLGGSNTYTYGTEGGAATHTLSVDNLPSHTHRVAVTGSTSTTKNSYRVLKMQADGNLVIYDNSNAVKWNAGTSASSGTKCGNSFESIAGDTGSTGSGNAVSNMPPYLSVYMWKRTA